MRSESQGLSPGQLELHWQWASVCLQDATKDGAVCVSMHCEHRLGAPQRDPQILPWHASHQGVVRSTVRMVDFDMEKPEHEFKKQGGKGLHALATLAGSFPYPGPARSAELYM